MNYNDLFLVMTHKKRIFLSSSLEQPLSNLTVMVTMRGGLGSVSGLRGPLQRVIRTAESITGCYLPPLEDIASSRWLGKAKKIIKDCSHPGHGLFISLPSGRRYRSLKIKTQEFKTSFYPWAVRMLSFHT